MFQNFSSGGKKLKKLKLFFVELLFRRMILFREKGEQ